MISRLFFGGISVNNIIKSCGLAVAVVSLSACATVTRGTSQKYSIESTPTAAEVSLSSGQQCITPCQLKLKRKPGFVAVVKKAGYQTQTLTVESKLAGGGAVAGAGNLLLGGVVGGIVDGTNGSMNSLLPNPLRVILVPIIGMAPMTAPAAPTVSTEKPVAAPAPNGE